VAAGEGLAVDVEQRLGVAGCGHFVFRHAAFPRGVLHELDDRPHFFVVRLLEAERAEEPFEFAHCVGGVVGGHGGGRLCGWRALGEACFDELADCCGAGREAIGPAVVVDLFDEFRRHGDGDALGLKAFSGHGARVMRPGAGRDNAPHAPPAYLIGGFTH
jgi:hypothetical protein